MGVGVGEGSERGPTDPVSQRSAAALGAQVRAQLSAMQRTQVSAIERSRDHLEREIFSWDNAPLAQALQALHSAGRDLHLSQLRTSWLQRVLRGHPAHFQRFAGASARVGAAAAAVQAQVADMHGRFMAHERGARRLIDELDTACRALGGELDRGVTLLQEMCNEIEARRKGGSPDPQLSVLAEQAQLYTEDFRHLQSIDAMVCEIDLRARGILGRRAALLHQLQSEMASSLREWIEQVGELSGEVRAGKLRVPALGKTIEAHDEAMKHIEHALDASGALRGEEDLMRQQLEQLRATLAGRART